MAYSIKTILHSHIDKNKEQTVLIKLTYKRMIVRESLYIKTTKDQFKNGLIKGDESKNVYIRKRLADAERSLLALMTVSHDLTKQQLQSVIKDNSYTEYFSDFIGSVIEERKDKFKPRTIQSYITLQNKIRDFGDPKTKSLNTDWLNKFEKHLQKEMEDNSVWSHMKVCRTMIKEAMNKGIITVNPLTNYKMVRYEQPMIEYLTESEMKEIADFLKNVKRESHRLAGYYFLLGCYAGFRISDLKTFNYKERVKDGSIILKTKKTGSIVSMPIHTRLKEVLKEIKDKPLTLAEPKVREYVKEIISLCGIKKRIKIHTARHSFAMLLAEKGFSRDDVAELMGHENTNTTKVYFKITNTRLRKEVLDKLK